MTEVAVADPVNKPSEEMKMTRGAHIVLDGPNATGKSSAMKAVAGMLREAGHDVVETREPGGSPLAERLRAVVLDPSHQMDTTTQLLLFNAARRSHILETIEPNVAAGRIVLCDRFLASSLVFQSLQPNGQKDLDDEIILKAHELFCFDYRPDLSIYLEAPLAVRHQRIASRAGAPIDRFEEYGSAFDDAAAAKFTRCGPLIDNAFVTVDASASPEDVARAVYTAIDDHLGH